MTTTSSGPPLEARTRSSPWPDSTSVSRSPGCTTRSSSSCCSSSPDPRLARRGEVDPSQAVRGPLGGPHAAIPGDREGRARGSPGERPARQGHGPGPRGEAAPEALGACSPMIETAGGGHGMGTGFVALTGAKNAMALRGQFLAQRDAIVFGEERAAAKPTSPAAAVANEKSTDVLIEIRDLAPSDGGDDGCSPDRQLPKSGVHRGRHDLIDQRSATSRFMRDRGPGLRPPQRCEADSRGTDASPSRSAPRRRVTPSRGRWAAAGWRRLLRASSSVR